MYCLDSDFLIEVSKGNPGAVSALRSIERVQPLAASVVTVFEVTNTERPEHRAAMLELVGTLETMPLDASVAIAASSLSLELRRRGCPLPPPDLFIAATCLLRNLTLVTRNARHFSRIRGLRTRSW